MGKQNYIFLIITLFLCCLPLYVPAQQPSYFPNIQYITSDEGLSQSEVTCILQDQKGFLWIGTRSGLNRYDGYSFKIFQNEIGNANSLINNSIESLFEDSKSNIWIGTKSNGVSCYNPEYDHFEHFQHHAQDTNTISGNRILAISESQTGEIWLGTRGNGLTILNPKNRSCLRLFSKLRVNSITRSRDGTMWVATANGLFAFSAAGQLLNNYIPPEGVVNFFNVIEDQESGKLYLGSWNQGVFEFDRQTESFRRFQYQKDNPGSISSNNAYHLYQDGQGRIWVGSWGGGLNLFHPDTETFTNFNLSNGSKKASKELYRDVLSIYQDQSGILWFDWTNRPVVITYILVDVWMGSMISASLFAMYMTVSWPKVAATQVTAYMAILNMSTVIGLETSGLVSEHFTLPMIFVGAGILQVIVLGIFPFIDVHQARRTLGHEAGSSGDNSKSNYESH